MGCCPSSNGFRIAATLVAVMGAVGAAQERPAGIVGRLTAETREEAVLCGRSGATCAVEPYQLCGADNNPYAVTLVTPFSRIAAAVLDAEKTGRSLGRMGPTSVNRWGVAIYVSPSERSTKPGGIERVEIHREGRVIVPSTTTIGPITVTLADGSTRQSARGFFAFPAEAFAPSADTTIVLVGRTGERVCTLDRARLETLR